MADADTTFPLTHPISLLVRLGHGSVSVAAREGLSDAVVNLTPRHGDNDVLRRVTVEMRGTTLVVAGPKSGALAEIARRGRDAIDAVVEVPARTPVVIVTATADISVSGEGGDADIKTGSANIGLDAVAGDLRMRYGHAECRVGAVSGSVQVRGGSGGAHFGHVAGRLDCGLGSGDLTADVVRGELRGRAGSGLAQIGATYGNVDIALGAGPITLGLPAGVIARVDITSGSGQTHSDLPVEPAEPTSGSEPINVRARTGSGEVRILRAVAA